MVASEPSHVRVSAGSAGVGVSALQPLRRATQSMAITVTSGGVCLTISRKRSR